MNYTLLNQYDIKFENVNDRKRVSFKGRSIIERYINIFNHEEDVDRFLHEISLAENGQFDESEFFLYGSNPPMIDYGADDGGAYISGRIYQNSINLSEDEVIHDSITIPLADWKEILLSWKEFLQT